MGGLVCAGRVQRDGVNQVVDLFQRFFFFPLGIGLLGPRDGTGGRSMVGRKVRDTVRSDWA